MNQKIRNSIAILLVILLVASLGGYFYFWRVWWPVEQAKITQGLAASDFPWRDYSQAELEDLYPQIRNAKVPTRVTPEETYAKFREALRTNNLELALEQLSLESKKYEDNINNLQQVYEEGKFANSLRLYPEKNWRSDFGQSMGNICYEQERDDGKFVGCTDFIKDANGDWKMDSL